MDNSLSYKEYVEYLNKKYGNVPFSYFSTIECKSGNVRNKRPGQGLYIHHVYESKYYRLEDKEIARMLDFSYQQPENLVYCNIYEHFLLHQKIILEGNIPKFVDNKERLDGIVMFIIPNLCSRFSGKKFTGKQEWLNVEVDLVQQYRAEFIKEFVKLYNYILYSNNLNAIEIRERYARLNYNLKFPEFITQDKPGMGDYVSKTPMNDIEKQRYKQLLNDIVVEIGKTKIN